jgi:hypothetical protein
MAVGPGTMMDFLQIPSQPRIPLGVLGVWQGMGDEQIDYQNPKTELTVNFGSIFFFSDMTLVLLYVQLKTEYFKVSFKMTILKS